MTSWARVNAFLVVLLLALVAATVLVLVQGESTGRRHSTAERVSARYADVSVAARTEILRFLHVDHRRMGPLTAAVLDGATGAFRAQYAAQRSALVTAAQRSRARSTGSVRAVGIGTLSRTRAVVYVAADSVVRSNATGQQPRHRTHRFSLTMTRTDGGWKLARLGFVR